MRRHLSALLLAFGLAAGIGAADLRPAFAAGSEPPPADTKTDDKKDDKAKPPQKKSEERSPEWMEKYRAAAVLMKAGKYEQGMKALAALKDADTSADVQNYLGFANRKLKRMIIAKNHYEKALALDPDHKGALEYYGEWHVDNGDLAGAKRLLVRLETVCGNTTCEEYVDLDKAIKAKDGPAAKPRS